MQKHSEIGERILAKVDTMSEIALLCVITTNASTGTATRTGFPKMKYPLPSRIIAVADAYNAMTSDQALP